MLILHPFSFNFLTREELLDRSKESNPWVILLIRRSIGFLLKFLKLNVVKLTGESLLIIIDFYFFQRSTKYQETQKQTLYIQFNELKWDRLFYNRMFYCENFQKKKISFNQICQSSLIFLTSRKVLLYPVTGKGKATSIFKVGREKS